MQVLAILGLAAFAAWWSTGGAVAAVDRRRADLNDDGAQRALTLREVEDLARSVVEVYRFNASPSLLVSIAMTESSFRPWVVGDAGQSHGMMQTKLTTATWLYEDLGYNAAQRPTVDSLKDPATSMYYGAAFVDWLSRYKGQSRDLDFIMRGYNAGAEGALRGGGRTYAVKVSGHHKSLYGRAIG